MLRIGQIFGQFGAFRGPDFWHRVCKSYVFKFRYWSKFDINVITGSGIMTIFFYKGLTRNSKIGNTPVLVLPNIWRLGQVMNTKFDTNVFNRMLLNAAKFQVYCFHRFWVIKGKPTEWGKITPLPTQIRVKIRYFWFWNCTDIVDSRKTFICFIIFMTQ